MPISFKVSVTASSFLSFYTTSIHIQLCYRNSSHMSIIIPEGLRTKLLLFQPTSAANDKKQQPQRNPTVSLRHLFLSVKRTKAGRQTLTPDFKVTDAKLQWDHTLTNAYSSKTDFTRRREDHRETRQKVMVKMKEVVFTGHDAQNRKRSNVARDLWLDIKAKNILILVTGK